jgi:hypothetical protein
MDAVIPLTKCKEELLSVFRLWKNLKSDKSVDQSVDKTEALRIALHRSGISTPPAPSAGAEISSTELVIYVLANAMDWALCKGFNDKDAIQFIRLYILVLKACRSTGKEADNTQLSSVLKHFNKDVLPEFTTHLPPPFSAMGVKYVFDTLFTHFHLYQLILCDGGEVEVGNVDLEVATSSPPPLPLAEGVPERDWKLQQKLKTLESEYDTELSTLRERALQEQHGDEMGIPEGLQSKEPIQKDISSLVDSVSLATVNMLSSKISQELDLYKTQVEYRAARVEAIVDSQADTS